MKELFAGEQTNKYRKNNERKGKEGNVKVRKIERKVETEGKKSEKEKRQEEKKKERE